MFRYLQFCIPKCPTENHCFYFLGAIRESACLPSNSHERTLVELLLGLRMSTATRSTCTGVRRKKQFIYDTVAFCERSSSLMTPSFKYFKQRFLFRTYTLGPSSVSPNAVFSSLYPWPQGTVLDMFLTFCHVVDALWQASLFAIAALERLKMPPCLSSWKHCRTGAGS